MNKKRFGRILLAVLISLLSACERTPGPVESKPMPRLVRTFTIESPTAGVWRELPGVVDAAQAVLELAKQNLAYTSLQAPFAGRVAKRYVENYEEVAAKQAIYTLQDLSSMKIRVDVPESVMIRVKEGSDVEVVALFDKIPGRSFPLTISEISTQANPDSNTFTVTFSIPRIDNYNILPGMSVTVRGEHVPGIESLDALFVPAQAVLEDNTGRYVYIAEPRGEARAIIEKRPVETGRLSSAGLEVLAGLDIGDRVVTAGMSKMRAGLEVRLAAEPAN